MAMSKPSAREVQKYIDQLNDASAELHRQYLNQTGGVNTPAELLQEATLYQAQITNVLLNQVIQNTAMAVDQLSILVKRRDK